MKVAGVDEAGRGPVIGPLVIGVAVIDEKNIERLRDIGVKDSKQLTPGQREKLFSKLIDILDDYYVLLVTPKEIDERHHSMNELEAEKFVVALNSLRIKPQKIYVDSADVDPKRFASLIKAGLKYEATVIAEHKADAKYEIVSAASIIAKVTRDREIEKLKQKYGEFGSGYPSDPRTKEWLEEYYKQYGDFPPIVRRTWETARKIEERFRKNQLTLDKFLK
ncbi:ribonuclease HII [Pyrococcus horikoshii]|uniref:Ribonuclease HII n=2 Tax=Pyrococcus horikoshii TaxID=53953 RepID=RNH2_PYRHO|nr:ribonuclease HII [Pyrococcus horikoshii]O59351.1 RecName: Full=Ribonuclease HII; Short=RNase HII [Pyrococcus horikoshii OT3]1UAX_A Chain A, Ribonuclease HII [Pyrococcus horikoshii OT3]1UAX_B Chain B, Ribonuclease HII [Pyrococcus horikoshii OT3]BAA30762.1 220aa long hypothetical ribonuclease H II [Pyrococcus horikoshii OT3]HII60622.1 ribonuclease HII [Pyrococcus horikoshii]